MRFPLCTSPPGSRAAWLARRRELKGTGDEVRFGGSSLADLLNIGYGSPYKLYDQCKSENEEEQKTSTAMQQGLDLEWCARFMYPALASYGDQGCATFIAQDVTRQYLDDYIVSVDGLEYTEGRASVRVFEVKTLSFATSTHDEVVAAWSQFPCGIHPKYYPQLELYCRAYDCDEAVLFVQVPNAWPALFREATAASLARLTPNIIEEVAATLIYRRSDSLWEYIRSRVAWLRQCLRSSTKPTRRDVIPAKRAIDYVADVYRGTVEVHAARDIERSTATQADDSFVVDANGFVDFGAQNGNSGPSQNGSDSPESDK